MTFGLILEECREKLGPPPRQLAADDRKAFEVAVPLAWKMSFWMGHALRKLPGDVDALATQGRIVWGYVVVADERARSDKNRSPQTAIVLYGKSPSLDDKAELLERVGTSLGPANAASLGSPPLSTPVPQGQADGEELFLAGTLLVPGALPRGKLTQALLPILVAPDRTKHVLPVPSRFWSEALTAYWIEAP